MKKNNNNNEKLKFSQTNILENTNSGKEKHNNIFLNKNINNNNIHKYQLTSHKNKIKNKYKDMSHYQRIY